MTKKLNTSGIINELRGVSPFFPLATEHPMQETAQSPIKAPQKKEMEPVKQKPVVERHHDTMTPSNHDTTPPAKDEELLEKARKAVRQVGKEAATHRFTLEEKNMLADIEYSYRRQGIRTSENEITRIAINYIVEDYHKNGEQSVLAKIIQRLNS